MADALWTLDDVWLGRSPARLQGISLSIGPGVTAVLGCSGAGKTSLLNLLVRYETPDKGAVIATLPMQEHALPVYWAPQTAGLWPHLTVREHVAMVAPPSHGIADAVDLLEALDVAHRADARPDELSEGERSRVAVARALAAHAAVLVMDEPFANVDAARVGRYWQVVRDHLARSGASLVFATHSPEAVLAEAERVICLREGRLIYDGPVGDLYWQPRTPEEADCLGESNWLTPPQARLWLGRDEEAPRCFRPEQLAVEPRETSPIVVTTSRFKGSVSEVTVTHDRTGESRRFVHRPCSDGLARGTRVVFRTLVGLVAALLVGCTETDGPALTFQRVRCWNMPPLGATLPAPRAAAFNAQGEALVLDTGGRVLIFGDGGKLLRHWTMPESKFGQPEGLCVLQDGRVAVADTHYHRVVFFDAEGHVAKILGSRGSDPGQFVFPVAVVQDAKGFLYVSEYDQNDRVQKFTAGGEFVLAFGGHGTGPGEFQRPAGIAWHDGRIYVADAANNRVQIFTDEGKHLGVLGEGGRPLPLRFPYDVTVGPDDAIYIAEYGSGRVTKASTEGRLLGRYGSVGRGDGQLCTPWGLAVDAALRILVMDTGNRRIVELVP